MSTTAENETCGGTGGLDCTEAVNKLWDYLDGQLNESDREAVRNHVEVCSQCFPHAGFGQVVLDAVAKVRAAEPEPPSLRDSVLARLRLEGYTGT